MSGAGGWNCATCTFYHHAPGNRCAMCQEPRVTKAQMRDFIQGKPIPDDSATSPNRRRRSQTQQASKQATLKTSSTTTTQPTTGGKENTATTTTTTTTTTITSGGSQTVAKTAPPHPPAQATSSQPRANTVRRNPYLKNKPSSTMTTEKSVITNTHSHTPKPPPVQNGANSSHGPVRPQQYHQRTLDGRTLPLPPLPTNKTTAKVGGNAKKPPRPTMRKIPYQPGPVPVCTEAALEWIYPNDPNYPKRNYQFLMTQTALFHNTLVALPTGLGKTLIAAVVLYNYYRWFPTGKVIFMAPTLPLVTQQVKACYDIMGIPENDTAVLTGKTPPERRALVWKSQRVFFCTPQTVQRDLEANRVDARQIVCIVLDEAHKATKDYAYCKVIQSLNEACAKFRVVGLSATPATTLKGVQDVVDILRINKVEARSDDDPDVKQYIHDRTTEIVIVQQVSASKTVERKITDIVAPVLETIRRRNAMGRLSGNATLTQYSLMKAREAYQDRTKDFSLIHHFSAAMKLVKMREDLKKFGIGIVRKAMTRFKTERQKGEMQRVVNSQPFQELWDLVTQHSHNPLSNDQCVESKVVNNPKLEKLQEILVEHFERTKAAGSSSRAIVFSQLRDSVSEIVNVLASFKPTIRPRHFVGQGKASQNDAAGAQVKGMTQAEQHQVIRQFRDNVFNVLVCTCIGEEGLDIGEVDLIVNFDTLKSPIRMIQRVGRTGRKRSGRVVCLVAEGNEQQALSTSKSKERTLLYALRRPESFQVTPTVPLLPDMPALKEENMQISHSFRMSQVEGNSKTVPGDSSRSAALRTWKLTEDLEARRAAVMGASNKVTPAVANGLLGAAKKHLFLNRLQRSHESDRSLASQFGRVSRALAMIESQNNSRKVPPDRKRRRANNEQNQYLDVYFPVAPNEEGFNKVAWGSAQTNTFSRDEANRHIPVSRKPDVPAVAKRVSERALEEREELQTKVAKENEVDQAAVLPSLPVMPDRGTTMIHNEPRDATVHPETGYKEAHACGPEFPVAENELFLPTPASSSGEESEEEMNAAHRSPGKSPGLVETKSEDELILPTQDSSSEESDAEEHVELPLLSAIESPKDNTNEEAKMEHRDPSPRLLKNRNDIKKRRILDDSPSVTGASQARLTDSPPAGDANRRLSSTSTWSGSPNPLVDTQNSPETRNNMNEEIDVVCAVCGSGESPDDDPIVLCDGPGNAVECEIAVHTSCYSIPKASIDAEEWRCEVCEYKFQGGLLRPKCFICNLSSGPLSRFLGNEWVHKRCKELADEPMAHDDDTDENDTNRETRQRRQGAVRALRKRRYGNFFDEEADIASDDEECDDDAEEFAAQQIEEEEEFYRDFINDSTQLGYTQDDLDKVDPGGGDEHRAVDTERAIQEALATPVLNRQMQNREERSSIGSVPPSMRGLGQMHFIRSVLEHHRQGGDADQIEQAYHDLEVRGSMDDTSSAEARTRSYHFHESDDSDDE